jgi:hypothetical protein
MYSSKKSILSEIPEIVLLKLPVALPTMNPQVSISILRKYQSNLNNLSLMRFLFKVTLRRHSSIQGSLGV